MKTLLVIDDEPGHRLMVRAVLEDDGWRVFEAASGEEALEFFGAGELPAHVALLDMNMPGLDGQATMTRLHQIRPGLPVILLTGHEAVDDNGTNPVAQAFACLTKPLSFNVFLETLQAAVREGKECSANGGKS